MNFLRITFTGSLLAAATVHAQVPDETVVLQPVEVVGSASILRIEDLPHAVAIVDAATLAATASPTLGETLDSLPGVTGTSFAPGTSRPIIRGHESERVRVLESGLESFDVSQTSPDHAVGIDPLLAGRVEVLRGPGTLLYGGGAIGGVVSTSSVEMPLPDEDPALPAQMFAAQACSGTEGGALAARTTIDLGTVGFLRLQGSYRHDGDYTVPDGYMLPAEHHHDDHEDEHEDEDHEHEEGTAVDRLPNSFVRTEYLSAGWATGWDGGAAGLASSFYHTEYGVPHHVHGEHADHGDEDHHEEHDEDAHEDDTHPTVHVRLQRVRHSAEVTLDEPLALLRKLSLKVAMGDYWHEEIEGDEMATRFERDGWEGRLEALHAPLGPVEGLWGASFSNLTFRADGEESFAPPSRTRDAAFFAAEEWRNNGLWLQAGGRIEQRQIDVDAALPDYDDAAGSLSLAANQALGEHWQAGLILSLSSRHPSATELYADGPHAATSRYEVGDPALGIETARGVELSLRRTQGAVTGSVQAFLSDFDNYIHLRDTGTTVDGLELSHFQAVDARFYGLEADAAWVLPVDMPGTLALGVGGDCVVARDRTRDVPLPRIPPARLWSSIDWRSGAWQAGVRIRHALSQDDVAPGEASTAAYTTVDCHLAVALGDSPRTSVRMSLINAFDELGYNHTSMIKDYAPIRGRSVECSVVAAF